MTVIRSYRVIVRGDAYNELILIDFSSMRNLIPFHQEYYGIGFK